MSQSRCFKTGLNLLVKLMVTCLLFYVIHNHILGDESLLIAFQNFYSSEEKLGWGFLIVAIFLMPLNWILESFKWQMVMNSFSKLNFKDAIKSVLIGVCFGIFTPARLGEYAGRTLVVHSDRNKESIYATFFCSLSQNLVNIIVGLLFFSSIVSLWSSSLSPQTFFIINLIWVLIGLLFYFNIKYFSAKLSRYQFAKKYLKSIAEIDHDHTIQIELLFLSFFRYAIYLVQFILVLKFYNLDTSLFEFVKSISGIYLIQSTLPIPPILDLFARGEIAVQFFGLVDFMPVKVIASSLTLWVINLILPSLIGLVLLMKINVSKSFGYGEN